MDNTFDGAVREGLPEETANVNQSKRPWELVLSGPDPCRSPSSPRWEENEQAWASVGRCGA